jgi:hypothetical protein
MLSLNVQQPAGWGHPAYKYFAFSPAGRMTPPGAASVKYLG